MRPHGAIDWLGARRANGSGRVRIALGLVPSPHLAALSNLGRCAVASLLCVRRMRRCGHRRYALISTAQAGALNFPLIAENQAGRTLRKNNASLPSEFPIPDRRTEDDQISRPDPSRQKWSRPPERIAALDRRLTTNLIQPFRFPSGMGFPRHINLTATPETAGIGLEPNGLAGVHHLRPDRHWTIIKRGIFPHRRFATAARSPTSSPRRAPLRVAISEEGRDIVVRHLARMKPALIRSSAPRDRRQRRAQFSWPDARQNTSWLRCPQWAISWLYLSARRFCHQLPEYPLDEGCRAQFQHHKPPQDKRAR